MPAGREVVRDGTGRVRVRVVVACACEELAAGRLVRRVGGNVDGTGAGVGRSAFRGGGGVAEGTGGDRSPDLASPSRVRVAVVDRSVARRAGVDGVLFTLGRADGVARSGPLAVDVDYRGFARAYGGDFGARLRLVALPVCVLTTPEQPSCRGQTPVASSRNNSATSHLSATVTAGPAPPAVYAAAAASSSPQGTWTATQLSPAGSWSAGTQGGDFPYPGPFPVPPGPGGLGPDLNLSVSSQSAGARTLPPSSHSSWVAAGW